MSSSIFTRRDSLVYQASFEKQQNEKLRRQNTLRKRKELGRQVSFKDVVEKLNDDGLELIRSIHDDSKEMKLNLVINAISDSKQVLIDLIQKLSAAEIPLNHLETRPNQAFPGELEILAHIETKKSNLMEVLDHLVADKIDRIEIKPIEKSEKAMIGDKEIWVPKHISDLDQCRHVLVKYEPTADPKHPGYGDDYYIGRRAELNIIANNFRYGDIIPDIAYLPWEHEVWKIAYSKLKELRETHTCMEYRKNIKQMEDIGLITPDKIPSLQAIDKYLRSKTGFQLRPCGGLLSARDFLASLAFRVFQTTLYMRHQSKPNHCPEPDIIHEILGHCAMFADPIVAEFSQEIGLMSIGATDEQIERLATLYWFTIEFGLCEEIENQEGEKKLKAFGAALISAFGELQFSVSNEPKHKMFDPAITALQKYEDLDYQPLYFVSKSIGDAMNKLREYAMSWNRPFINVYDSYTQTVNQLSHEAYAKISIKNVKENMNQLSQMMGTCKIQKI